jgi:hypothetical protein
VAFSKSNSPVVADGIVSDERLAELLGWQTEYPDLDYKRKIGLTTKEGLVEFAKDVGAFQVLGGYFVAGVDGHGVPTGDMDGVDPRPFDEANLAPMLEKYLPQPLEIRSRVLERDGHTVVLIFVGRHPPGFAIFHTDGEYEKNGKLKTVFRAGDAFWREGTRSVRLSQQGMDAIIERRIAEAKGDWVEEQQEIRLRDQEAVAASYESRRVAEQPLGSVNFDLETPDLINAVLELLRSDNPKVPLIHLLNDALARARDAIERDEIESELANLLDKLTCLAATFLEYEQDEWFDRVVATLARVYSMPLRDEVDARRFGYATRIDASEKAPRVWLLIVERVFGLGALAVRRGNWEAVRTLAVQLPKRLDQEYDANWLRHALTMSSRSQLVNDQTSLLSLARNEVVFPACVPTAWPATTRRSSRASRSSTPSRTSPGSTPPMTPTGGSSTRTSPASGRTGSSRSSSACWRTPKCARSSSLARTMSSPPRSRGSARWRTRKACGTTASGAGTARPWATSSRGTSRTRLLSARQLRASRPPRSGGYQAETVTGVLHAGALAARPNVEAQCLADHRRGIPRSGPRTLSPRNIETVSDSRHERHWESLSRFRQNATAKS